MTARQLRAVDGGRAPDGWEQLWSLDRWSLRALPHADLHGSSSTGAIVFSGLVQPWLKEAAKRWMRVRLLSGTAPISLRHYVEHLQAFSGWLSERASAAGSPAVITRELLEDYCSRFVQAAWRRRRRTSGSGCCARFWMSSATIGWPGWRPRR